MIIFPSKVLDFPLAVYQSENVVGLVYAHDSTRASDPGQKYTFVVQRLTPHKTEHSKSYTLLIDAILECLEKVGQLEYGYN